METLPVPSFCISVQRLMSGSYSSSGKNEGHGGEVNGKRMDIKLPQDGLKW